MAAPSYTTDLTELAIGNEAADSGTWAELSGHTGGSAAGDETDYYINNASCISQQLGTKTGTSAGIEYLHNAAVSLAAGEVMMFWQVLLAGNAIDTFINGGMRMYIGSSSGNVKVFKTNGSDFNRNPYGGWLNVAIDPTNTGDYTDEGSPNGTDWRLVGSGPNLTAAVSKGYMHGVGKISYGRGDLIFTGGDLANGYATFDGAATQNDSQNNRWGLLSLQGGVYVWKGLMSWGTSSTAVDLRDANRVINIDQTPRTYAAFNRIEVNNTSSTIELNSVAITAPTDIPSGESSILSKGQFEMIDTATLSFTSCTFTDMDTFVFNKGANSVVLTNNTWRRCNTVTQGSATFTGNVFDRSSSTTALSVDALASVTGNTFISDGTGHAIDLGTITSTQTLSWDNTLDDGTGSEWTGSTQAPTAGPSGTANDAILVNVNSGQTLTISVATGATIPTVQNTGTGNVEIVAGQVTTTITVQDGSVSPPATITDQTAHVILEAASGGPLAVGTDIIKSFTDVNGQVSDTRSFASDQPVTGWARRSSAGNSALPSGTKYFKETKITGTISSSNGLDLTVLLQSDE